VVPPTPPVPVDADDVTTVSHAKPKPQSVSLVHSSARAGAATRSAGTATSATARAGLSKRSEESGRRASMSANTASRVPRRHTQKPRKNSPLDARQVVPRGVCCAPDVTPPLRPVLERTSPARLARLQARQRRRTKLAGAAHSRARLDDTPGATRGSRTPTPERAVAAPNVRERTFYPQTRDAHCHADADFGAHGNDHRRCRRTRTDGNGRGCCRARPRQDDSVHHEVSGRPVGLPVEARAARRRRSESRVDVGV
jgi:hypothetical protein